MLARRGQVVAANGRQKKRREALRELNALTVDAGFAAAPLRLKEDGNSKVEQRVRALQRRCPDANFRGRLHAAAKLYVENDRKFSVGITDGEDALSEVPLVLKHRVLTLDSRVGQAMALIQPNGW